MNKPVSLAEIKSKVKSLEKVGHNIITMQWSVQRRGRRGITFDIRHINVDRAIKYMGSDVTNVTVDGHAI